ncbi:phenylacetate--CoA ligase family protein [Planctopirus hydrillae]|uniref:CoF synthetase n=1 Tax=Planctopirus hydrillae TaxID=1841610 RepID=A0A1C3ENE3_9PLAN|nr:hypothetical protein [Planctopirus hydrillae]ODA34742.1 hypothetical protein A6X21_03490 [Planctopirus hydrillae]
MKKQNNLPSQTWIDHIHRLLLGPRDVLLSGICRSYGTFLWCFKRFSPSYLEWAGKVRARRAFLRAVADVPAYARFVADWTKDNDTIPETDKQTYIKAYPIEERCVGGKIPSKGIAIDESSGSTGTPFNWVRSTSERKQSHLFVSYFAKYCFGRDRWITINAFSMGAWATGVNMGIALQRNSIVKNTGPDLAKILNTLSYFGSEYRYLIVGYPPFLKHLMDAAKAQGFPWDDYKLDALVGGEGMSEGLRDYLRKGFLRVYSGYGASDLEIGIAGETPLTVAIRRLARDNPVIRQQLFGNDSRLPMLFQYNPLMHHIEVNENREVIFTITRAILSPRIRYNVHDEGGIARFDELANKLTAAGYDFRSLEKDHPILQLPFLWIYGRRDFTVSVMGANIYPEDLEQCVYSDPKVAGMTLSFCQSLSESESAEVRPCFHFEIDCEPNDDLRNHFSAVILKHLVEINADFREAWHEYPETLVPEIHLHRRGEGPFKVDAGRIKQTRKAHV